MKKNILFLFIFTLVLVLNITAQVQSIKNGPLWRDTNGNRIQAHGVSIMKYNGVYYMLGEDRTNIYTFKGVNLYSSTDLMNWQFRNTIIDNNTNSHLANLQRITERPCLLYNASTNRFVVWLKYQNGGYTNNKVGVFYCNTIDGKYTYVKEFFPKGYDSNDDGVFVDTDGKAYYISTNKANGSLNLYTLTDDYMDAADATILFAGQNQEAPVIFKKDNLYYMICSSKTGWDPNQMKYNTSSSLKSGWSTWKNLGDKFTYDSQPTEVITITGTEETNYFYVGDRWKDPGLPESKTVIFPMTVSNAVVTLKYVPEFTIDLTTGKWTNFDSNTYVPQTNWSLVSISSAESTQPGTYAFDNNINTFWHTKWSGGVAPMPHEIIINLGSTYNVAGFVYVPRQDNAVNGIVREFQLFLSDDGANWKNVAGGWISYWSEIYFASTSARYMKFVSKTEIQDSQYGSASELKLITNNKYIPTSITSYYQINGGSFINGTTINIDPGKTLVLGPQPNSYGSYSWSGPNDFFVNTRAVTFSNITTNESGEYTVCYLDDRLNCHSKTIKINVTGTISSVEIPSELNNKIQVYSNQNESEFNIKLNGIYKYNLTISDMWGRTVYTNNANEQLLKFSKGTIFKPGIYIVRVMNNEHKLYYKKFVVK